MSNAKVQSVLEISLSILMGALFIFSAWTKTYPSPADFEYIIKSQFHIPGYWSTVLARLVIGVEFALGFFLLLHFLLKKKWIIVSAVLLLLAFSIHLLLLYLSVGNEANCGCMGTVIEMKPLPSILKNVLMIGALMVLLKVTKGSGRVGLHNAFVVLLGLITVALMFVVLPIKPASEYLSYSRIYDPSQPEQPAVDLREGRHIVSFMTLGCGHCRDAAKEIVRIREAHPEFPFYIFLLQPQPHIKADTLQKDTATARTEDSLLQVRIRELERDFFEDTKASAIPHSYLNEEDFVALINQSGNNGTPTILWMQDSVIIREVINHHFNVKDIENWLKAK